MSGLLLGIVSSSLPAIPPDPVSDLIASSGSYRSIALSWTAPNNNGLPITDYKIEQSTDGGTTWTTINDGVNANTTYNRTGLGDGQTVTFRVAAINAAGQSTWADPGSYSTATTLAPAASGGTISYNNGYWVHTFATAGDFVLNSQKTVEILAVGAGQNGQGGFYGADNSSGAVLQGVNQYRSGYGGSGGSVKAGTVTLAPGTYTTMNSYTYASRRTGVSGLGRIDTADVRYGSALYEEVGLTTITSINISAYPHGAVGVVVGGSASLNGFNGPSGYVSSISGSSLTYASGGGSGGMNSGLDTGGLGGNGGVGAGKGGAGYRVYTNSYCCQGYNQFGCRGWCSQNVCCSGPTNGVNATFYGCGGGGGGMRSNSTTATTSGGLGYSGVVIFRYAAV